MSNEELIKNFINGPLHKYLTDQITFHKFIELTNEACSANFKYTDLYPSYLFNATLQYPEEDMHESYCAWHSDWHECNCGRFDK